MKSHTSCRFFSFWVFLIITGVSSLCGSGKEPSAGWPEITKEHRPGTYWWWPGSAVDPENLTRNLETLKKAGFGGTHIIPIYGVKGYENDYIDYLSGKWMAMLKHTVVEADRLGLFVDMTTGSGWNFGGPGITAEYADKIAGYKGGQLETLLGAKVKRSAPGGEGLKLNPYSVEAMKRYLVRFDEAFEANVNAARGVRAQYHDSYEYKGNWSPQLLQEFKKRWGYDLGEHLDTLFEGAGTRDTVGRVRADYRRTLAELHLEYIQYWAEWARGHRFKTRNQAHGAPANLLDLYSAASIPETETFGASRFKMPGFRREMENTSSEQPNPLILRMASSAAHVTGKPLVSAETNTWLRNHFKGALSQAKPEIDQLFLCGVNHIFYHGNCYSPMGADWPGWLFYASWQVNPGNSIWRDLPYLNTYVARCQSILQQGQPDNDILLYWPIYDVWQKADDPLNKQFKVHNAEMWLFDTAFEDLAQKLIDWGYSIDYVSDTQLQTAEVAEGRINMQGGSYQAIVVPETKVMPVETLRSLVVLKEKGAQVIVDRALPLDVPGFHQFQERREQLKALTEALSASSRLEVDLREKSIRREPLVKTGAQFIRRSYEGGHLYFIANMGTKAIDQWITWGVGFQSAVIMDPQTGRNGKGATRLEEGKVQLYLQLQPGETRIVKTFDEKQSGLSEWSYFREIERPLEIVGPWSIDFIEGEPILPESIQTKTLGSWTDLGGEETKRFAGTGRYRAEFEINPEKADEWVLDLGEVRESARIIINGKEVGAAWAIPFRLHVGDSLKAGKNTIEIEVTNLSANRIRDLDIRGVYWKRFHDINFVSHLYEPFDASQWELTPSGLLGPIMLRPVRELNP